MISSLKEKSTEDLYDLYEKSIDSGNLSLADCVAEELNEREIVLFKLRIGWPFLL